MPYADILYEVKSQVAWLTINRPEQGNSFRRATILELIHALNEARNDGGVRVVVLTGAGDRNGPQALGALKAAFHARHNGVTGLSRVAIDHLVANYYHTDEAKEMGRSFSAKQPPDPDKFYR
jgi:1,4-dihydroxy-2-naphthoyl-CoA synthase